MPVTTIEWTNNKIRMIDQTKLPEELIHLEISDIEVLAEAIKSLRVRGGAGHWHRRSLRRGFGRAELRGRR